MFNLHVMQEARMQTILYMGGVGIEWRGNTAGRERESENEARGLSGGEQSRRRERENQARGD